MAVRASDRRSITLSSLVCAAALLAVLARRGHAQQAPVLPRAGSYVRVRVSDRMKVGTSLWSRDDTLSLGYCCGVSPDTIPLDSIRAMDVHEGAWNSTKHVVGGMAIGLFGGAGLAYGISEPPCRRQDGDGLCEVGVVATTVGAALVGLIVGGVVGANIDKKKAWRPVRLRVSVAPDPRSGLRLGLAIPLR